MHGNRRALRLARENTRSSRRSRRICLLAKSHFAAHTRRPRLNQKTRAARAKRRRCAPCGKVRTVGVLRVGAARGGRENGGGRVHGARTFFLQIPFYFLSLSNKTTKKFALFFCCIFRVNSHQLLHSRSKPPAESAAPTGVASTDRSNLTLFISNRTKMREKIAQSQEAIFEGLLLLNIGYVTVVGMETIRSEIIPRPPPYK